ncbi:MAG: OmpA family protein [Pseudomonadota bacterium]|nr:OmpA family protein [Pseudomonadota bacterium]
MYRDKSWMGAPVPMIFLIDGTEIYGFWRGQRYSFRLAPGDYAFGYYLAFNECRQLVMIEPGQDHLFKLAPNCVIEREYPKTGAEIIQSYTIDLVNDEFDFNKSTLKPEMKRALDDLARRVKATSGEEQLTIIGHTDSVGSEQYNYELGLRRAAASKNYLVNVGGLNPARIRTESAGERDPVATNETEQGRAKNRRIEVRAEIYGGAG